MTGIGAYLYIIWGIWLRHCLNGRQDEYQLWWPHFWNFPDVLRTGRRAGEADGPGKVVVANGNGSSKKSKST